MNEIQILCNNSSGRRWNEPVSLGVPFSLGKLKNVSELALLDSDGRRVGLQTLPLAHWSDGSVKWLLCDFLADVPASSEALFQLKQGEFVSRSDTVFRLEKHSGRWKLDTGAVDFEIDTRVLRPFHSVELVGSAVVAGAAEMQLIDLSGQEWTPQIDQLDVEALGPVRASLSFSGGFRRQTAELLRFEARLHVFAGSSRAALEMRLHNQRGACHPGNLWDLGDPASVMLREWSLSFPLMGRNGIQLLLKTDDERGWRQLDSLAGGRVYQESSGGEHWDSPVHRNRDGRVPMTFCGWRLSSGGRAVAEGRRAQPLLWWGGDDGSEVCATIDHFWQRFPKAAALTRDGLLLSLLPPEFPGGHEIQGGEQVTETVRFDFSALRDCPEWGCPPLDVRCAPEVYRSAGVFPDGLWQPLTPKHAALAGMALDERTGFPTKRERLDEYGWRNFGDVYADHEAAFHKGDQIFVSHYNNQYDLLNSFFRLYLAGCDPRWGELARDLAAHVADIDIYHTNEDREEYCHGPFWHTDHYLDAALSTHRMASREHLTQKNPAFCGGGPAAEHCYSMGLALHFFLTGDPRSRKLVLELAEWCWRSINGPQTVGAALLRAVKGLVRWRRERGVEKPWSLYPFSRGTGNCLNATLNAFEVTRNHHFLARAAELVQGTVHPEDCPGERDLLNAEVSWSYNVFLSALGRFLQFKLEEDELDGDYHHARSSLLTYARWMVVNEYPYLERPEILEFPNETWAAQDLRKGVVLLHAARHAGDAERPVFLERARYFLDVAFDQLLQCDTGHYTRPLALVLQNGWAIEALSAGLPLIGGHEAIVRTEVRRAPRMTLKEVIRRSAVDLLKVLKQTKPLQELNWLRSRLMRG